MDEEANVIAYARFLRVLRPLAYANEFGDSFRNLFPKLVKPSYFLSFGYIGMDIWHQVEKEKENKLKVGVDSAIWHSIASITLPTFTIHSIVKLTNKVSNKKWMAPVLGLASIPLIVGPIDHGTDNLMDGYIRPKILTFLDTH